MCKVLNTDTSRADTVKHIAKEKKNKTAEHGKKKQRNDIYDDICNHHLVEKSTYWQLFLNLCKEEEDNNNNNTKEDEEKEQKNKKEEKEEEENKKEEKEKEKKEEEKKEKGEG